jgi:hypothetical protein
MLKGIRSRSLSRDKGIANIDVHPSADMDDSHPVNEPQAQVSHRATPESSLWGENRPDHSFDPSFNFTQDHPIGSILLKQQADITKLAEKVKMYNMSTNIHDLCNEFSSGIQLERANTVHSIAQKSEEMEDKIITRELQSHQEEYAVDPPANFALGPTLINNPSKLNECLKVFSRSHKFSGATGQVPVIEFLTDMKLAQEQCNLSEKEFLAKMLAASTGQARELLMMWIENNKSAAEIYSNLLIHYDRRPNIDEAKRMLLNYKIAKNEDLAIAEGKIMRWVGLVAKSVPKGPSRDSYSDFESCHTLIRALPEWGCTQVENIYKTLSAKTGHALSFNELHNALHALRPSIDRDIRKNGIDKAKPSKFVVNKKQQKFYNAYNLEIKPNTDTVVRKMPQANKPGRTENSFTPRPLNRYNNTSYGNNNNSYNNNSSYNKTPVKKPINLRGKPRKPFTRTPGCILCGFKNHEAKDCRNMKDDNGVIKKVLAPFGKCQICPASVQPRLNHPPALCPFRPSGPLANRAN